MKTKFKALTDIPEKLLNMNLKDLKEKYSKFTWPDYAVDYVFKKYFVQRIIIKVLLATNIISIGVIVWQLKTH